MGTLTRSLIALFAGMMLFVNMIGDKSRWIDYYYATTPLLAAPKTAGDLLRRINKYPEEGTTDPLWKTWAAEEFERDLNRMKWTWYRELGWNPAPPK